MTQGQRQEKRGEMFEAKQMTHCFVQDKKGERERERESGERERGTKKRER